MVFGAESTRGRLAAAVLAALALVAFAGQVSAAESAATDWQDLELDEDREARFAASLFFQYRDLDWRSKRSSSDDTGFTFLTGGPQFHIDYGLPGMTRFYSDIYVGLGEAEAETGPRSTKGFDLGAQVGYEIGFAPNVSGDGSYLAVSIGLGIDISHWEFEQGPVSQRLRDVVVPVRVGFGIADMAMGDTATLSANLGFVWYADLDSAVKVETLSEEGSQFATFSAERSNPFGVTLGGTLKFGPEGWMIGADLRFISEIRAGLWVGYRF